MRGAVGQNIHRRITVFHVTHSYEWYFVVKSCVAKSVFHTLRNVDYSLNQHLWFQPIANFQISGPIVQQDSLSCTSIKGSYWTLSKLHMTSCTHNCTHTHAHTHMHVYTKPAITVDGINDPWFSCNKITFNDVHTLYIIHSNPPWMNSAISQYCSRILSNEYNNWQHHPLWDKLYLCLWVHYNTPRVRIHLG